MNALQLLDSRSFRNKLDAFIAIASKKRAKDEDLAEYLQPVLDAAAAFGGGTIVPRETASSPKPAPFSEEDRIVPQKERSIVEVMDDYIKEWSPRVAQTPMDQKGIRWFNVPDTVPMSELTGYLMDKTDAPFFVDASEMTMMNPNGGGWMLPLRTR